MKKELIERILKALGRLLENEGTNSAGEYICYCDDYKKPDVCPWCDVLQALCAAQSVDADSKTGGI